MDEQRAWLKARRKRRLRILAVMLSVCVLFTTYPDILATLSVFASEEQAQAEGRYISGFTALSNEIREQTVPVGTELTELSLPDTLEAVVTEQPSEDTAGQPENDGKEDSGENNGKKPDGDTTGAEDKDSSTGETEEGELSDSGQGNTEENNDTDVGEETGDEQDTQPEKDGESEETDGKAAAGNEEAADTEKGENTEESAPAEERQESASAQEIHTVTMQEYHAENMIAVQTLENTQTEKQEETVTINGITWQSEPEYDGSTEGIYTFTAVLPEGYTLAEGVSLPQITVTVKEGESGTDFAIQTLLDRIAALPDVEEYLAIEPDMEEDEDAYAELDEKLYEYAEEALAIWEEYEALTEEQQAQMPEEELAKLVAWVEIAEQLSDRPTMLADNSEHHGESDWMPLTTSHTTLFGGKFYLSDENGDLTMGTITIDGDVTLCLNGHKLQHDSTDGSVIVVTSGTFTLCDCQDHWTYTSSFDESSKTYSCGVTGQGGCIIGGNGNNFQGGGVYVTGSNTVFNMNGGRITGGNVGEEKQEYRGGGVYVTGGTFNMSGGFIDGNKASSGGGIYLDNQATFTMSGNAVIMNNEGAAGGGAYCDTNTIFNMTSGNILGNKDSTNGGGVFVGTASFNMSGGTIEGNVSNGSSSGSGVGCYRSNSVILSGGSIQHNISAGMASGGVRVSGTVCVSDSIHIFDNYNNGEATNLSLNSSSIIMVTGELSNDIGITYRQVRGTVSYPKLVVTGTSSHSISDADWSHFSSDDKKYEIQKKETTDTGNELYLAEPGKCNLFDLTTDGAKLSPSFDPNTTEYTSTVANSVNQVGITATLADASNATIKIKTNDGTTDMISGKEETVGLNVGKNTIVITVTSGELSKTYTIEITREEAPTGFTVTLNGNGGSAGTDLTSYDYGTGATLPTDWTRTGYSFAGWYENENCTGAKVENISATATGDKEYWASWTPTSYNISYDLDGGTVTGNPTSYTIESSAITLINPTKTGYSFGGWSGTDLTDSNNMSVTIAAGSTGDREYTAHWTAADYTVTLNGNGGQGGTSLISYAHGTGATLPTDWTRAGYSFAGWYDNENCIGTEVTEIPATATGNKEYWAKWTPISYTITYVLDGGNVSGNPTEYTIESNAITLNNPTKEGYTFTGWSGTDLTGSDHMSVTIASGSTGHRTYTANWKLADYTVNLHTNGGTGGTDLTSYTFGTGAVLPTDWQKAGYVFDGWYEDDSCTGTAITNISGTDTGDKEYWAKWTDNIAPVIGTLTFNYQPKNFWHWLIGKDSLIITVPVTEEGSGADKITYTETPDGGTAKVETATIQNGEAKITVSADFKGTVSIACTDQAGNTSASVTVGAGLGATGIIIEDNAPKIAFKAENAELLLSGEYKTAPNIVVTVADDKDNAISGGIASVSYKIGDGSVKTVPHNYTASMVVSDSFTISADEIQAGRIPADGVVISVTATDNAGNSTTQNYTVKVHTHSGTLVPAVDPTCTTAGNKEHYTCTCGKLFSDSGCTNEIVNKGAVVLDALGHHFEGGPYIVSTTQHWRKCSRCSVTEQKEDHTFGADDKCTVCGYSRAVDPGHTHSGTLIGATEPTCTLPGNIAYYSCSSCGKLFSDSGCTAEITEQETKIAALGHDFTMQKDQSEHWQQCSRCSLEQSRAPHVYDNDTDTECNVCGYVRMLQGHTHSGTLVAAEPATCTEDGHEAYYTCSCGKWFSDSACTNEITDHAGVTVGKLGHNFVGQYLFDADGHWKVCSRCNAAQTPEGHVFDDDNNTTCNKCNYQRTLETHTHSVERVVAATEPTCTTAGNKTYYICSCGKWFSDSACTKEVTAQDVNIPAKGHTVVTDPAKAATCTETGLSEGSHCSVCGHVIKAQTVTAALGHDYSGNYHYDANGHWKVCSRCGTASAKQRHSYDNDRDTRCNDCGWVRTIPDSDSGQDEQPTPAPAPEPSAPPQPTDPPAPQPTDPTDPPAPQPTDPTDPPAPQPPDPTDTPAPQPTDPPTPQPTEKPDNPGTAPGTPDNSQPEDKQGPESTGTPEPTEKPSETGKEQQPEGDGEQTVPASTDNGKIVMSGEPVATGNVEGMTDARTVLKLGDGAVIVTVVCAEQEYTAGVADTLAVANAVLTPEQVQLVNNGGTIEIRIDVKDISDQVPEQDKEVIENGIEEYRKEVQGLVLGMYVDISMFIRIGEGGWNAITEAEEPVEIIIGIPEKLQEKDRTYYIIRAHDGVHAFMDDMDDEPGTITVSTDLFSSYAIAYVQTEGTGHKCGLCHICPTFLRLCCFVWLAIIILIMIAVIILLLRKKKENQEAQDTGQ